MTEDRLNAYHIMWLFVFFDLPVTTKRRDEGSFSFPQELGERWFLYDAIFCLYPSLCIKGKFGSACKTGKIFASGGRKSKFVKCNR